MVGYAVFARMILKFGIVHLWLYYQPVDSELPRNFLVDPSQRQVDHPWNRLLAYTTHTYGTQHNKQAVYQYFRIATSTPLEKNYDEVTQIIIDCDECNTYWQN